LYGTNVSFSGNGMICFLDRIYSYLQLVKEHAIGEVFISTHPEGLILVIWKNRKRGGILDSYK
jgi:hypothetical protein